MQQDQRVYDIISKIPVGKVATYGMIAQAAGIKNPRHVGNILHKNPEPGKYPCHRVVNSQGKVAEHFAFGGGEVQRQMLLTEGVPFLREKVDLPKAIVAITELTG